VNLQGIFSSSLGLNCRVRRGESENDEIQGGNEEKQLMAAERHG
jgi:hypothetical protein